MFMALNASNLEDKPSLDKIDKKIMYAYSQNCRLNQKKLASKLRISPEKLHYRINKLKKHLLKPGVVIDPIGVGLNMYFLFVNHISEDEYEIYSSQDEVYLASKVIGHKELISVVLTNNLEEFLTKNLPNNNVNVHSIKQIVPDNFNGFNVDMKTSKTPKTKPMNFKNSHFEILHATIQHPENTPFELSQKIDYDYRTIRKYQDELHNNGIIKKWRYEADIFKMGFQLYLLHVQTTPNNVNNVLHYQHQDKYSGFLFKSYTNLFFWYMPKKVQELDTFIQNLRQKYTIQRIDVYQIGTNYKINMNPPQLQKHIQKQIL